MQYRNCIQKEQLNTRKPSNSPKSIKYEERKVEAGSRREMLECHENAVTEPEPGNQLQAQQTIARRRLVDIQHFTGVKILQSQTDR